MQVNVLSNEAAKTSPCLMIVLNVLPSPFCKKNDLLQKEKKGEKETLKDSEFEPILLRKEMCGLPY